TSASAHLAGAGEARVQVLGMNEGGGTSSGVHVIRPSDRGQPTYRHHNGSVSGGDLALRTQVRVDVPAGTRVALRNFKLKPTGARPVFNGKDLSGWKVFPGRPAKFTGSDKGEVWVQNGPGDLQTEGEWADFVLQIECLSNGKHLNSGVFFRCQPDKYQQGYEAQIHNGFTKGKDYTVEEYDPDTHKL